MELFKTIRLQIGTNILLKKLTKTKRNVYYFNFSKVKNIGLVWDASRSEDFPALAKFQQRMNDRSVNVRIIGYYPEKILPDKYTAVRYLGFLRRNELNFFYQPESREAEEFIKNPFDVLIDLNFKNLFPLKYITSLSKSPFKVGLFTSENEKTPFDLMMEIKEPVSAENYLNQIIEYLELINSEKKKE